MENRPNSTTDWDTVACVSQRLKDGNRIDFASLSCRAPSEKDDVPNFEVKDDKACLEPISPIPSADLSAYRRGIEPSW